MNVLAHLQNKLLITQQILQDTICLENIQIQSIKITKPSLYPIVSIRSSQIYLNQSSAKNNIANFTNQNSLFTLQAENLLITNSTLNQNSGFQNLLLIQNTQQGNIQSLIVSNNLIMAALLISQSNIQIQVSQIKQNQSKSVKQQSSVVTIIQNSLIQIQSLEFEQNQSNNGGSLFISSSQLIISQSFFKGDKSILNGGSIYSQNSQLTIQQSQFYQCSSMIGGCIFAQEGNLNISQLLSQNNTATQLGGFLYINQLDQFILQDIDISNSISFGDGGSIYIQQSKGINSVIAKSTFLNNQAKGSGGSILTDNSNFQIIQCKFQGNSAGIGGAIRYLNLKPAFMLNLKNNIQDTCNTYQNNECYNNTSLIFGNSIASYPCRASVLPSKYFNVHSEFPNISFSNFQSGLSNFDLVIVFFDEFNNPINQIDFQNQTIINQLSSELFQEISQYSCRVHIQQVNSQLQNQTIKLDGAQFSQYQYLSNQQIGCFINGLKITGIPSQSAIMNLQLYGMKAANKSNQFTDINDIQIKIQFRSCQTGEYYNKICQNCLLQECVQCMNGTYSLIYPFEDKKIECKSCDMSKSYSCYSDQIILRENYWRINNHSDLIYECNQVTNSCNGDSQKGYCADGFVGALCSSCDAYGKVWGQPYQFDNYSIKNGVQCIKCSQYSSILLKELFAFTIISIYLIVLIIQSQDSNCKVCLMRILQSLDLLYVGVSSFLSDNQVISKIFINQFQILSTLKYSLRINISQVFSNFLTIPQSASQPINVFTYSFDCILSQIKINIPIQYKRFINISLVLPLIFIISFFIFVYLILQGIKCLIPKQYFFYKTKYLRLNVLISALIVLTYIASQNIYQAALENIFCDKYSNVYYMKSQMDEICYTQEHYYYIFFLIGPVLFVVSVVYPITMLIILYRNRFKLFDSKQKSINLIRRYGYLFKGFKKDRWWWEILKTWYKFLITFMATLYRSQPLPQILSIIFLQMIYLYLLMKYQPYQHYKINLLEKRSVIYTLLIFQISIVYLYNSDGILSIFSQIGLIILLVILLGRLILSFIEVHSRVHFYAIGKIGCLRSICKYLRNHLQGEKCKFWIKNYLFNNFWGLYNMLYIENYDPYRVFGNWKKLRLLFKNGNIKLTRVNNTSLTQQRSNKKTFQNQTINQNSSQTYNLSNYKRISLNNSIYSPKILQERDNSISPITQNTDYFQFSNYSKQSFKTFTFQGLFTPKKINSPINSKCVLQAKNSEKDNQAPCVVFQNTNPLKQIKKQRSTYLNTECQSIFSPKRNSVNQQNILNQFQFEQDYSKSPISKITSPSQQLNGSNCNFKKQQNELQKLNINSKNIKKIRQLESYSSFSAINQNSNLFQSVNQQFFQPQYSNTPQTKDANTNQN
ncbi:transmembrane protein, putative (macronuclear) [Tetrahymena thermophila SB210]|uniref:Transmembrane protein, putative n=1 Tax=Tetrahymena thermophila (strain SB210) TaxID=312017 RepID=Q23JH4_TETTS|nr:transmembrane protein, putative [Tetrahymena thermophila SB210]EAR96670.2 transmembrane protein, putative [Tetrahymena thermophila SB210]|eukprot:XP_001016915.2 transmembrane protein, putative [Tetrahymena thermophila SB210]